MVYQKQLNEHGPYIAQDGKRYEILSCSALCKERKMGGGAQ